MPGTLKFNIPLYKSANSLFSKDPKKKKLIIAIDNNQAHNLLNINYFLKKMLKLHRRISLTMNYWDRYINYYITNYSKLKKEDSEELAYLRN